MVNDPATGTSSKASTRLSRNCLAGSMLLMCSSKRNNLVRVLKKFGVPNVRPGHKTGSRSGFAAGLGWYMCLHTLISITELC